MYYPYLRSKQNEMLALREIAQSTTIHYSHIMPIIVQDFIAAANLKDVILVFKNDIDSDNENLWPLLTNPSVKTIIGRMSRSLKRNLLREQKQLVTFKTDAFHPQNSNAQYASVPDELYTEEHTF